MSASLGTRLTLALTGLSLVTAAVYAGPATAHEASREHAWIVARPEAAKATFRGAIDTHDRQAVNLAYWHRWAPNQSTAIGWTGNNAHCRAGRPSHRAQTATLESLNFVRALGGLAPVTFSRKLSRHAQKAALIMSANSGLSHDPPRSWKCWSREGANAAGNSNLALSWPVITAGGLVHQYMDDDGSTNTAAGHRRWIMFPSRTTFGSGSTTTSNALWVFGPAKPSRPNPEFVAWPTAGWFPGPIEPGGRWSISAGDATTDFSHARVRVTTGSGAHRHVHRYPVVNGYGQPTLVWRVAHVGDKGTYKVAVRGIKTSGHPAPFAYHYVVRLFTPQR